MTSAPPTPFEPASLKSVPHYTGHRQRLRDRFLQDPTLISDYELLELILYWVFPRQDTKPLAKKLLAELGSFAKVVHASSSALKSQKASAAFYAFQCLVEISGRLIRAELQTAPLLNNTQRVLDYCTVTMAHAPTERLRLFFVDRRYYLLQEDLYKTGTLDQIALYPREFIKRALELNAAGVLLVHNHPSGDPTPSAADITVTQNLRDALIPFNVTILDHFILGRYGYFSFREKGIL